MSYVLEYVTIIAFIVSSVVKHISHSVALKQLESITGSLGVRTKKLYMV